MQCCSRPPYLYCHHLVCVLTLLKQIVPRPSRSCKAVVPHPADINHSAPHHVIGAVIRGLRPETKPAQEGVHFIEPVLSLCLNQRVLIEARSCCHWKRLVNSTQGHNCCNAPGFCRVVYDDTFCCTCRFMPPQMGYIHKAAVLDTMHKCATVSADNTVRWTSIFIEHEQAVLW